MTKSEDFLFSSDDSSKADEMIISKEMEAIDQCLLSAEHLFYAAIHVDAPIAQGALFKVENLITSLIAYARIAGNTELNVKRLAYAHVVRYSAMLLLERTLTEGYRTFHTADISFHNEQLTFFLNQAKRFEALTPQRMEEAHQKRLEGYVELESKLREIRMGRQHDRLPDTYAELVEYTKELDEYIKHLNIEGVYGDDGF